MWALKLVGLHFLSTSPICKTGMTSTVGLLQVTCAQFCYV